MGRFIKLFIAILAFAWSPAAMAEVKIHFHSFDGSVLFGRYPHAFVVLEGTLSDGTRVDENYGFSALRTTPAILNGPVQHTVISEKPQTIAKTNRHFTMTLSDSKYYRIKQEVAAWRDAPGKYYSLESRNCIHFVGRIAQIMGLEIVYPNDMLRRPKKWLNYISALNPRLGAPPVK